MPTTSSSWARAAQTLTAPGAVFATEPGESGGRPALLYTQGPRTMRELVEATRAFGERPYLVSGDRTLTYARNFAEAAALAHRFVEVHGLRKGDRVVIAMRNRPEWQTAFWATQLAGLVAVPMNAWWTAQECAHALDDCGPALLIVDGERVRRVSPWLRDQPSAQRPGLLTVDHDGPAGDREERWADLPEPAADQAAPDVDVHPEDDATILYTSGTTGRPKGAVATHRNNVATALNARFPTAMAALSAGVDPQSAPPPVSLVTFPFFHVAAFTSQFPAVCAGGTVILMHRWDAALALELIRKHQVTSFGGVPTVALQLLTAAEAAGEPLETLRILGTGGAAAPPELARRVRAQLGGRVDARNGYGLTETCGGVISNYGDQYQQAPDSIGRPSPATEVRIAGPDGTELPEGDVGELQLRGQSIFRGYWDNPEATEAAFVDGWFRTGDLARVRAGVVSVVDRIKDLVIRGGENVYCVEVESALIEHPAVADAAVLGVPHPELGQEVAAVVQLAPGASADPEQLRAHVGALLAHFKVPAHLLVQQDPLPRNPTGKVVKRNLRMDVLRSLGR